MLRKRFLALISIIFLIFFVIACSGPAETSTSTTTTTTDFTNILIQGGYVHPEIPRFTCEELKQQVDSHVDLIIVDTRPVSKFKMSHLPGAVNIPYDTSTSDTIQTMDQMLETLPDNTLKVFYCDCPDDGESANMAQILIEKGYNVDNIKVLWKGFFRWIELGYPLTAQ
jgi:rhodanese-related sulfurtransferase